MNRYTTAGKPSAGLRPELIESAVTIPLFAVLALALAVAWWIKPATSAAETTVARCDRMAQIVSSRTTANTRANLSAQWRRERDSAFAACLEDPEAFARSQVLR